MTSGTFIYYFSRKSIDQIYSSIHGPTQETTETTGLESTGEGAVKAGIGKLAQLLGLKIDVEGKLGAKKTTGLSTRTVQSSEDRAVALLREMLASPNVARLEDLRRDPVANAVYVFRHSVKLKYAPIDDTGERSIEVGGRTEGLEWTGVTSESNWVSKSLKNNLIWQSQRGTVPAIGLVVPLSAPQRSADGLKILVQYLLIISPLLGPGATA
jgi:hypothetical protein